MRELRHNLPAQLTAFVGRAAELVDIEQLISERRLVTLAGVGGCGKTRLAVQVCRRLADRWRDGAWFVDLGSVADPALVAELTASTVGVLAEPADHVQAIANGLRRRQMLLCLDTCEHLLDATATLADTLLRNCPDISVLATSRAPLGVEGETVWRVPTLKPDEATLLFADRAGLVAPGFDLDAAYADAQAVCARADHLPLAIELAAAWVRVLSPAQIAAGLEDRCRLLAGGRRRTIPRHQTLVASMSWSHGLLEHDERIMFRRLAVFAGSFTLEAAAAVCGDGRAEADSDPDVLHLMGRLVDKSLVSVRGSRGEVRFCLLDTIRQYAEEQLRAAGEAETIRDRHLDYFLMLSEDAEPGLESDQDNWRELLDSHRDNINAALRWGLASSEGRAGRGRRLAAAMARQWFIRGQSAEGLDFLRRAIEADPADRSPVQGRLLAGAAMLGMLSGRLSLVAESAGGGLEIAGEVGADVTRARCLAMAAYRHFFVDFERCQMLAAEAAAAGEMAGDPFARDFATMIEGYSLQTRSRNAEAAAMGRLAFERSRPRGDRFCAAFARGIDIFIAMTTGDVRGAAAIGQEVIRIAAPLGDYFAVGTNTSNAALAVGMGGDTAEARKLMEPIVRSVDNAPDVDVVGFMVTYGWLHLWDGDLEDAVHWFERGVQRLTGACGDWTAARSLPGLVAALRRLGRVDEAAEYAAMAVVLETGFQAPHELTTVLDEQARLVREVDPGQARDKHLHALAIRRDHGLRTGYADSLDALALLEADAGNHPEAVRLLAVSDAARDQMGYPRPPVDLPDHDAVVALLHTSLGDEVFQAARRDGAARSIDDVVAMLTRGRGPRNRPRAGWESLTPAELDVVHLAHQGRSNPEIASRLYVSRSTVKAHLSHVYAKLGVANRTELAAVASRELPRDEGRLAR